jgi:asparagine synthase (glutamine-hydrolysing)
MCGIAGIVDFAPATGDGDPRLTRWAQAMGEALHHRGPDGQGIWSDPDAGAHLAHTRLAVIDLMPTGQQPMLSRDGALVMVFNGEIYNHRELRARLLQEGVTFRGHSDTEVLLEAIARWGLDRTLAELAGMFAIALWYRRQRRLILVRDRFGKKPLFVVRRGDRVAFASEITALRRWPQLDAEIEPRAVCSLLSLGYVSGGLSILREVRPLPPGHRLCLQAGALTATPVPFWCLREAISAAPALPPREAEARVSDSLQRAVRERMVADVPLGALLSGGIDSSLVLALMQRASEQPVRSFSVGFSEQAYDESGYARALAAHLGSEHVELRVDEQMALSAVTDLARVYDEPFADSSQLPMLLIARLTRGHVTVALSGDGGDELFGGYNRHVNAARLARYLAALPSCLRRRISDAVLAIRPGTLNALRGVLGRARQVDQGFADRVHKLARLSAAGDLQQLYHRCLLQDADLVRRCDDQEPGPPADWLPALPAASEREDVAERFMVADTLGYLPDDILVKIDRASMSCALEVRSPFLDHRVFSAAWSLTPRQRIAHGQGKQILRRLLAQQLPPALFERPKAGFAIPLAQWLRGGLRDWAEALLSPHALAQDGYVDARAVRRVWAAHLAGRRNAQHALWPVLMLRAWREETGL